MYVHPVVIVLIVAVVDIRLCHIGIILYIPNQHGVGMKIMVLPRHYLRQPSGVTVTLEL